tara:strand:- start:448 stop:1416 length:969 start_codon:yes stop_codon:yes gene_type:complete
MNFAEPLYLILLLLIPILIIWYKSIGRKNEGTIRISSSKFFSSSVKRKGKKKHFIILSIQFIILIFIILAIARPRLVSNLKETSVSVIDILLVLDISSSMLADDFTPNRLEAVKMTAINFIKKRKDDRIGILVFAGEPFIQCPLTIDKSVLESLIHEISVASKESDGTAIGMAIVNGINRFRNSDVQSKVMILLSDGSNNSGEIEPVTAAEMASQFDIRIYTIGAGTNQSYTRIPGRGLIANEIDEETLKKVADVTNGKYFRATDISALEAIYNEISTLERTEIDVKEYAQYKELYGWLLIPVLIIAICLEIWRKLFLRMWY